MSDNIKKYLDVLIKQYEEWIKGSDYYEAWVEENKYIENFNDVDYKYYFISDVFEFTTYENYYSALMAKKCLEVCETILYKNFEYIKNEENALWYNIIINMPILNDKLNLNSSIHEIRFEIDGGTKYESYWFPYKLTTESWGEFIKAIREFIQTEFYKHNAHIVV